MIRTNTVIAMIFATCVAGTAVAQGDLDTMTSVERTEFTKLVNQRNDLYHQLKIAGDMDDLAETRWVQNQLDVVERRLAEVARNHGMQVPPRPVTTTTTQQVSRNGAAMPVPGVVTPTAKQRAEFNKLVYRRNKLHRQLSRLDEQAAEMIKRGEKPIVVYAEQVSSQDELDLVELQLAILATRYNMSVPPVPGRDPMPAGHTARIDDDANRSLEAAFARGRERAIKQLADDTDEFLSTIDFHGFLND